MKINKTNWTINGITAILCVCLNVSAVAESTLVVELQEKLSKQGEVFSNRMNSMVNMEKSRQVAGQWYKKAKSAPLNSSDREYAVSQYVNQEASHLLPMIQNLNSLIEMNDKLESTVDQLADAIEKDQYKGNNVDLRDLNSQQYYKTVDHMMGTKNLLDVMMKDPETQNIPEFFIVRDAYKNHLDQLRDNSELSSVNPAKRLREFSGIIEAQHELMLLVKNQLRSDYQRLKTLSITDSTAGVSNRIYRLINQVSGFFSGEYGKASRKRTGDLLNDTKEGFKRNSFASTEWNQGSQWLKDMRKKGPSYE